MNLKYRIYSVSSQNQEYPASNLQQNSGTWESQKNCTYPQDLTLQFYIPIQTKNMKIMFHQYKIPKLIQLFVRCGKHEKYRKLGLIQPNDNKQSNYIQKQIKTVLFQFPCTFVKLVFHQNYHNELNLFGQVALCSLSFEGQFCPSSQLKQLNANILQSLETSSQDERTQEQQQRQSAEFPKLQNEKKMRSSNFSSVLFPQFFQKLQNAKKQSVDKQQFQKAAFIKNAIKNFQQLQKQIIKLEQLKKLALDEQDYDRCHKLKLQIGRKKQMAAYQIKQFNDQLGDQNALVFSRVSTSQHNVSNFNTHRQSNRLQTEEAMQKTPVANRSNVPPIHQYENQVVPALRKKNNVQQSNHSIAKINQSMLQGLKSPTTDRKQQLQRVDESIDMRSYDPNKLLYQFPQLQNLDFKSIKKYEQFFDYIRQQIWRMVLSYKYEKYWKLKSAALDEVMSLQISEGKHLIAIMQFVAITICDKHTVNVKKSLNLLQKLISLPDKDIWCDPNYPRFFADVILSNLIQLMNDTKQEFRKLAVQVYKNLPQFSLIYLETAIKNIIKTSSNQFNKNKRKSNPRLQMAKLAVIQYYISTFADVVNHLNQIIKWLAECANDPSSQVKMAATQMLLEIARMDRQLYLKVKEQLLKVSKDAWDLFQPQYNALLSQIQSSKLSKPATEQQQNQQSMMDIYKKQTMKSKNKNSSRVAQSQQGNESLFLSPRRQRDSDDVQLAYSQQSISNDPSRSHAWFASNNQKQIKVMDLGEQQLNELEGMCDFCYKKYEQATVNDHLLNNCCVVIPCTYCGSAIYLRQMTEHFLSGCDKKKHQQCPRCLLAFQFDEINEHVARKICRKAKSNMERCPFCEEDIEADDVSWVDHAEKCDKIVRPKRQTQTYS